MKKLLLATILICISYTANAQISRFLEKGQSGVGIQALYEKGPNYSGWGGKIGGSIGGIVDLDFVYASEASREGYSELINGEATANFFSGKATWWLFRTEVAPTIEVNLGFSGGFKYNSFDNYVFKTEPEGDTAIYKSSAQGTFGIETSVNFRLSESWYLQPSFSMQFEAGTETVSIKNDDQNNQYTGMVTDLGLTLIKRFAKGSSIFLDLDQFIDVYGSGDYYYAALGYAIPF